MRLIVNVDCRFIVFVSHRDALTPFELDSTRSAVT